MKKPTKNQVPELTCPCWPAPQANLGQRHLSHINPRIKSKNNQWIKKS